MKAVVVGFGSIGARHAQVLTSCGYQVAVVTRRQVDWPVQFSSIPEALSAWLPDLVVIASRTVEHFGDLSAIADTGYTGAVLIEKPMFDEPRSLPPNAFSRIAVGYNLRFHPTISALRKALQGRKVLAVYAYVGQYLPQWRPQQDYRVGYSASREQGGGALRELSHELDLVTWLFGPWQRVSAIGGHFSHLEISADDIFTLLMETSSVPTVSVAINFIDSRVHRNMVILTDSGSIRTDLIAGTLDIDGEVECIALDRNKTFSELYADILSDNVATACNSLQGDDVMKLIAAAELAAETRQWICR